MIDAEEKLFIFCEQVRRERKSAGTTHWSEEVRRVAVSLLPEFGNARVAKATGLSVSSLYRWRHEFPDVAAMEAKEVASKNKHSIPGCQEIRKDTPSSEPCLEVTRIVASSPSSDTTSERTKPQAIANNVLLRIRKRRYEVYVYDVALAKTVLEGL